MATKNAAVLTEDDGDDGDAGTGGQNITLRPVQAPALRVSNSNANTDPEEFEVVEVDDRDQPLQTVVVGDGRRQTQKRRPADDDDEGNLSEDDARQQTFIEQQRGGSEVDGSEAGEHGRSRSTSRRHQQKEAARRTKNENVALKGRVNDMERELEQLRTKVGVVEPRVLELGEQRIKDQAARLDQQLADAGNEYKSAQQAMVEAFDAGDKAAMVAAMDRRDTALIQRTRLENAKTATTRAAAETTTDTDRDGTRQDGRQQTRVEQRRPVLPPAVKQYVEEFSDKFDWYDPRTDANGDVPDRDSRRVLMLDNELFKEGYDPASPEYWEEMEVRMREILPHRFREDRRGGRNDDGDDRRQNGNGNGRANGSRAEVAPARRGPMTTGSSERSAPAGRTQVRLSPDRKNALIEAQILGNDGSVLDKAKFTRVLKQYADHDRTQTAGRS